MADQTPEMTFANAAATSAAGDYDQNAIRTLESRSHMRHRPGMYIGALGNGEHNDDGIYVLFKEVVDNSIDEFMMGAGRRVITTLAEDETITVRDYGRGIPLEKLEDCVSKINTGGKFGLNEDDKPKIFSASIGMNGVGLKAVNFLSEEFEATSYRDGKMATVLFREGLLEKKSRGKTQEPNGTYIRFRPSVEVFGEYHFEKKFLERRLQHYAWLNAGLSLEFNGEKFFSRRGLRDLVESKLENPLYEIVHFRTENLEFAFAHTNSSNENYYSFANSNYTNDGGTHLSAFKEAIAKAVNEIAPKDKQFDPDDIRAGLTGAIAIRMENANFDSQTKHKLTSPEPRAQWVQDIKAAIVQILYKNPDVKQTIFDKIAKNESVRKQIQSIRKGAKELEAKSVLKIKKLRDCKFHLNEADSRRKPDDKEKCLNSMIFLTEGDSAAGSVSASRNAETQAVFALRGVITNCFGLTKEVIYKNEELYGMMKALGAEENTDNLRYAKVVIATDADYDGFHIRNLLITFFLTFFPQLVTSEHLYILETPLFRARSKSHDPIYCYTEKERDAAMKKIGRDVEVTRFKGLGEINPKEFGQFIRPETIKLLPVTVEHARNVDGVLNLLMGNDTHARYDFIMQNLVIEDSEA